MAREKPDYRTTLEQLNSLYPGRELLTLEEMKAITGYKTRDSIAKHFPTVCGGRYNKATVARILAGGEKGDCYGTRKRRLSGNRGKVI